ncbi:peptidase M16 domain protein [Coprobacillus sp. CAG:698]|nr:peptidase M16 domain protein [Coprobacillus sp. CAG:698]
MMITHNYDSINEKVCLETLENGLQVVIIPKSGFKRFFVGFQTKFGSIDIKIKVDNDIINFPKGTAHFLEHKMFEKKNGQDVSEDFAKLGLDVNAYTCQNSTSYYFSGLHNLEKGLNLLLDFVQNPHFTTENVNREKEIIKQELLMYQDKPSNMIYQGIKNNLYKNHPLIYDICGTIEDIMATDKEVLNKAHRIFYHPSNMSLIIGGDVDPNEVIEIVRNNQSQKTFANKINYKVLIDDDNDIKSNDSSKMDIIMPKISVGIKFPVFFQKNKVNEHARIDTLIRLFFGCLFGSDTNFYQNLFDDKIILSKYYSECYVDDNAVFYNIEVDSNNPLEFFNRIQKRVLSYDEFDFSKELIEKKKRILYGMTISDFDNVESETSSYMSYLADNNDLLAYFDVLNEITNDDVKKIGSFIKKEAMSYYIIYPNS